MIFRAGSFPLWSILATCVILISPLAGVAWAGATAFPKTISLQGIRFHLQSSGEGSQQQLTLTTTGAQRPIKPMRQTVHGRVVGAQVADFNGTGLPEISVALQGAGSGSIGELVAFAVSPAGDLAPIHLQVLTGAAAQG